jgi:hypothetical protein
MNETKSSWGGRSGGKARNEKEETCHSSRRKETPIESPFFLERRQHLYFTTFTRNRNFSNITAAIQ